MAESAICRRHCWQDGRRLGLPCPHPDHGRPALFEIGVVTRASQFILAAYGEHIEDPPIPVTATYRRRLFKRVQVEIAIAGWPPRKPWYDWEEVTPRG